MRAGNFSRKRRAIIQTGALALGTGAILPATRAASAEYAIPAPPVPSAAIVGENRRFPVHRIYCAGQNYAAHAREMGSDPEALPPFLFMKPADAVTAVDRQWPYPSMTAALGHEVELVVALASGGMNIPEDEALRHVYGYAVGLDMTRRDLQEEARTRQRPWETSKSFDGSAPCGAIRAAKSVGHMDDGRIWLQVNSELRQDSDLSLMIWPVSRMIAEISKYFELVPGDLIFTGTPEGVGLVNRGDTIRAGIEGLGEIELGIV